MRNTYEHIFSDLLAADQIRIDEPMASHVTFGIGGPADCFLLPHTAEELCAVAERAKKNHIPFFILGGGANVLVRDKGIRGVVIYTGLLKGQRVEGERLTADAGVSVSAASRKATESGLAGLEFASGIPGTVGGAAYMNAGAYGAEMRDVVESVVACGRDGRIGLYGRNELRYAYRSSVFMEQDAIIVSVTFALRADKRESIRARTEELDRRRREKQPLDKKSAGSTFKRPLGRFVGQMIEEAGLKGLAVGDAKVSEKHGGFLINDGHATCADMLQLIKRIQERIYRRYGVELETEVRIVGEE